MGKRAETRAVNAAQARGREDAFLGLPPDPALRTLAYEYPTVALRLIFGAYWEGYEPGGIPTYLSGEGRRRECES